MRQGGGAGAGDGPLSPPARSGRNWVIQQTYLDGIYVFQQDLAPVYTARTTQKFFRETMVDF